MPSPIETFDQEKIDGWEPIELNELDPQTVEVSHLDGFEDFDELEELEGLEVMEGLSEEYSSMSEEELNMYISATLEQMVTVDMADEPSNPETDLDEMIPSRATPPPLPPEAMLSKTEVGFNDRTSLQDEEEARDASMETNLEGDSQ